MSTAQITASPRAPRGKPQSPAPNNNAGRQPQRKPRGNRANNGHNHNNQNGAGASPGKLAADPTLLESAAFSGEEAQMSSGPRNIKQHTRSQPSTDRVFSPSDSEAIPINPSATPAKIQAAYAGPTFHASPAPSALPIPKFLSRSVPAKAPAGPPTPPPDDSSDSASPSPCSVSPSRAPVAIPSRNVNSPLDMLFKADKAERAKNIHGSPVNVFNSPNTARPHHFKHDSYHSLNGVFPIELDGESKTAHMSPPPAASPASHRSTTDPNKVPQLQDVYQQNNGNDVIQDLFTRLSMSQKKPTSATPPRPEVQGPPASQLRQTPSPFHDGRPLVRSASGPSTPQAQPTNQETSDFFYGNRNLSPLFKAAKGDSSKRNSGLRTEITAESPMVGQGAFQGFPSVAPQQMMDPNTFSRDRPGSGNQGPVDTHRASAPFVQPYQQSPNNRKTPGRQPRPPRPDNYPARGNMNGPGPKSGQAASNGPPASVPKPSTTMMSFVPASVAAKQRKTSATPLAGAPPMKTSTPSDTLALEQDLKRLLNLNNTGDISGVR
ncbi:hypothetical protein BDW02DRAFT_644194 [Decorospora gaudefroyi]|uniref:Proteophosphoglycan 5 n=1 Tax=Decorospora gaudefroyi TaxID=184978 RepID=A0A6A5KKZ0_9PLEO|nr:hypothetical protein BDW02DRAFT_644194 [Decorospora gaudefroyi]